jgi:hypothetical protein
MCGDNSAVLLPLLTTPALAPISRYDKMNFIFNVLLYKAKDDTSMKIQVLKRNPYMFGYSGIIQAYVSSKTIIIRSKLGIFHASSTAVLLLVFRVTGKHVR